MTKDLFQSTKEKAKKSNQRKQQNKNRIPHIITIAALTLSLTSCGALSGKPGGNPDKKENPVSGQGSDMEESSITGAAEEEPKEWPEEHDTCEMQELGGYLYEYAPASPYASAKIAIKDYEGESLGTAWDEPRDFRFAGVADVTWRYYNSLAEMETGLNEAAMQETDEDALHFLYYTFPMTENDHVLDLYNALKEKFDTEKHPLSVWSADNGKMFHLIQETMEVEEDGYEAFYLYHRSSKVNLYVKDRAAYGLTLLNAPSESDDETLEYVFYDIFQRYGVPWQGGASGMDEENLYWVDHEERLTELEDPKRSFREVRGIDENEYGITGYFGVLAEADYELPLTEDGRMLSLHFSLVREDEEEDTLADEKEMPAEEMDSELRYFLLQGFCMDESYDMTVTDMRTGEVLQERRVSLSIELPDTITYPDLNGDGCADMRIGKPTHINETAEGAEPEDYIKLTGEEMIEYEVQEGDSLWRISERFYGTGYQWTTIMRAEGAPEDPNYLLVGETVFVPEIYYIRKDPLSLGGLRSEGSFQIEQPYGFAYYFLNGDLTYASWEEENQIHCLPITNPVEQNPFHEPEDWEAFQAEAIRCSEELCPGKVLNLTFEKSHMEDGCDLYGYCFEYDTGDEIIEYVDFFKFGKANMSEVIGVREQEPNTVLVNTVRYVAASFTDYGGKPGMGWGDGTIPNVGADQWEYPYLHNLFEAAREQFDK